MLRDSMYLYRCLFFTHIDIKVNKTLTWRIILDKYFYFLDGYILACAKINALVSFVDVHMFELCTSLSSLIKFVDSFGINLFWI